MNKSNSESLHVIYHRGTSLPPPFFLYSHPQLGIRASEQTGPQALHPMLSTDGKSSPDTHTAWGCCPTSLTMILCSTCFSHPGILMPSGWFHSNQNLGNESLPHLWLEEVVCQSWGYDINPTTESTDRNCPLFIPST